MTFHTASLAITTHVQYVTIVTSWWPTSYILHTDSCIPHSTYSILTHAHHTPHWVAFPYSWPVNTKKTLPTTQCTHASKLFDLLYLVYILVTNNNDRSPEGWSMVQLCSRKEGSVIVRVIKNHMSTYMVRKLQWQPFGYLHTRYRLLN